MRAALLALLLVPLALAATFDITVSVDSPEITITYTKPVHLQETELINTDPNAFQVYELVQVSPPAGQEYADEYVLVTRLDGQEVVLPPGDYQVGLAASDTQGASSNDLVNIHLTGLDIVMTSPRFGVAPGHPYDVYFVTELDGHDVTSSCGYSTTDPPGAMTPAERYEGEYRIPGLDYQGHLTIECTYQDRTARETFLVSWDATPPTIEMHATPNPVTNPNDKSTTLTIETNEPTVCTVDGDAWGNPDWYPSYTRTHEDRVFYPQITDTDEHVITHEVTCTNLAGLETAATIDVAVNLGLAQSIEVLSPGPFVNSTSFTLTVRPLKPADTCTVGSSVMQPSGNTFTLPFTGIAQGSHTFGITCVGTETVTRDYVVVVDTTAPTLTVNASQLLCAGNVSATWNSTDNDQVLGYEYVVQDELGEITAASTIRSRASVPLGRPLSGTLSWHVTARDRAGNSRTVVANVPSLREGSDEECGLPPFIRLVAPALGFAPSAPYTVKLETKREAACRYALVSGVPWDSRVPFTTTDGRTHEKDFSFADQLIHVWCVEPNGKNHTRTFHIGVDTTPPLIGVTSAPNPVVDPAHKVVVMTVTTNDPTHCTYNGSRFDGDPDDPSTYGEEHVATLDFRDITTTDPMDRAYNITCTNLAGLRSTTTHVIHIDLGTGITITRISPGEYTSDQLITLAVRPNLDASCEWKEKSGTAYDTFDSVTNNTHSVSLGNLAEGTHQYDIRCTGIATQGTSVVGFTVERTPPDIEGLTGPADLCVDSHAKYTFKVTGLDKSPTITYALSGQSTSEGTNTTGTTIPISSKGYAPGQYTLSVVATSRTGLESDPAELTIDILPATDAACLGGGTGGAPPATCSNGIRDAGEDGVDCGGTCSACVACAIDTECKITELCTLGICTALPPGWKPPDTTNTGEEIDEPLASDPTPGCTSDYQCNIDQVCSGGTCVKSRTGLTPTQTPIDVQQPVKQGGNWLALTFIILGLILMGGSGWYLYQQHTPGAFTPNTPPAQPPQRQAPTRPQSDTSSQQVVERQQLLKRIEEQKAKKQRDKAFDTFDKKKDDKVFDDLEKL